ncbi:hypothetical protein Tco_0682448 [Tanacetum coccineum]|uniref:Reverse transcriptase domain-containing protein n=1 Tax=Tanacetum coccineum TaxID=301880 RepID=A0ABQ4XSK0_9ASTR
MVTTVKKRKGSYRPQFSKAYSEASHINNSIPKKEKDLGSFTFPCFINNVCFDNALVDLGVSATVMPLSTYLNLGLGKLAHTKLTAELADRMMKYPKGIAKNVLVGIVGEERIIFTSVKPASNLIKRVYMLSLRERMEFDLETRLMGETLVLNRSLDPFLADYIKLIDLNEPFELRRNQGDDLMPTIKEGKVIKEFRTRDDELDVGIDDYPSYYDYDKKIHIDYAHNLKFSCMIGFEFTYANFFPLFTTSTYSLRPELGLLQIGIKSQGYREPDTIMSDSEDSTVTYIAVSMLSAPPSPDLCRVPKVTPPSPDFVPKPVYLEFMPPEDEVLLAEEQPLPAAASPTADSPGYVPESDPRRIRRRMMMRTLREIPADYPADGGDDGDDEDESFDDDEDDDVDIEGDEGGGGAPLCDSTAVAFYTVYEVGESSSAAAARPTGGFRVDYGFVATMDREIMRDLERDVGYGITDTWDEMLVDMPGAPATDDTELGRRMTEFTTRVRQDTYEIYTRLDDEQTERQLMAGRLNMLYRDRRAHARTALLMEREARMSREAWGRSMDASDLARSEVMSLRTTVLGQQVVITELLKKMAPTIEPLRSNTASETTNTTSVTNAQLQAMINQGVTAALVARDADRNTNDDDADALIMTELMCLGEACVGSLLGFKSLYNLLLLVIVSTVSEDLVLLIKIV